MDKNRNTILAFYFILSLVVILCGTTSITLQNIGYALIAIELVAAYIARRLLPRSGSFEENHTTYIIRTIWINTLLVVIGTLGAATIVVLKGNMDAFNAMTDPLMAGAQLSEEQLSAYAEQFAEQYISDNENLLQEQSRIWLFPAQIYLVWRILQGGKHALKGAHITNHKRWF